MLGDLLLEVNQPAAALTAYEAALKIYPARFTGLYGAARSAEALGRKALARQYYKDLLTMAKTGDGTRPELAQAKAYLAKN